MFPSWIRSRSDIPRPMYFLATLTTSRRLASVRRFSARKPSSFRRWKCARAFSSYGSNLSANPSGGAGKRPSPPIVCVAHETISGVRMCVTMEIRTCRRSASGSSILRVAASFSAISTFTSPSTVLRNSSLAISSAGLSLPTPSSFVTVVIALCSSCSSCTKPTRTSIARAFRPNCSKCACSMRWM